MKLSKKIARTFVFPVVVNLGLERSWRNRSKHTLLNILYHGVVNDRYHAFSPRHIERELFVRHIRYLKREFEILSIQEAFDVVINNKPRKRKAITISFDDGYVNNLNIVLPIIEQFQIPVTFFISSICTQKTDIPALWSDVVACVNHFHRHERILIDGMEFHKLFNSTGNIHLMDYLKGKIPAERDQLIRELIERYNLTEKIQRIPEEQWKLLSKEELYQLSSSPFVDIGSHGHLHYNLGDIPIDDAVSDMRTSKTLLEEVIQKEVSMIAYPDGSYSPEVKDKAGQLGFGKQLAVFYKFSDDLTDPRILPRHGMAATTTYESGVFFLNKAFDKVGFH